VDVLDQVVALEGFGHLNVAEARPDFGNQDGHERILHDHNDLADEQHWQTVAHEELWNQHTREGYLHHQQHVFVYVQVERKHPHHVLQPVQLEGVLDGKEQEIGHQKIQEYQNLLHCVHVGGFVYFQIVLGDDHKLVADEEGQDRQTGHEHYLAARLVIVVE